MADSASATTPIMVPIPPGVDKVAGPLILGYMFNWGLYGVLCIQVYIYYLSFPRDPLLPKLIVYFLLILETLQVVLNTHDVFDIFGLGYGNVAVLNNVHFSWFAVPMLSGIISATVQIFYAYRITVLSSSKLSKGIGALIVGVAIMQCTGAIVAGAKTEMIGLFSEIQASTFVSCSIWLAGCAFCDVLIAISMTTYLWNSKTGFNATKVLLTKLVRLTIETGTITATFAIIDLSLFLAFPNNNYHTAPALCLAKMYSNTLMVMLNARSRIVAGREAMYGGAVNDTHMMSTSRFLQSNPGATSGTDASLVKGIRIRTEMWRDDDVEMTAIDQTATQTSKSQWDQVSS
ncbi:hypothetical protein BDN72DRAFT_965317 [Pluteus cervinus]|uniref:Uncharacterized protein n=1 Tax=Pluteus cervinus TaxID=181527 RepID=A0ACD3A648_9AGAR|nr:hypothetical protein BDN72DRAFT_965317 [Pluteus cervinus]